MSSAGRFGDRFFSGIARYRGLAHLLQGVLFEEHYPEDGEMLSALDGFDDTMLEYFRQRGAGDRIWSQEMVEKFTQPRRTAAGPFFRSQGANLD